MTKHTLVAVLAAALLVPSLAAPSRAQDRHGRGPDHDRDRFEHREREERFHDRDWDRWHGGHWYHGRHGERDGWWWVIGGDWYFYSMPVYPYPDPYALPVIVAPPVVVTPVPQQTCREYHGDAIIDGTNQPFYGNACLGSDGRWHIVSR